MWYNAITSERFFFFAKRTELSEVLHILCSAFGLHLNVVNRRNILFLIRGRRLLLQKSKSKNNFRKAGGAVMRVKITLACTECKQRNYNTMKNKKNDPDRLEMNKYCRFCKKHTLHKETK